MTVIALIARSLARYRERAELSRLAPAKPSLPRFLDQRRRRPNLTNHKLSNMLTARSRDHSRFGGRERDRVVSDDDCSLNVARIRMQTRWNVHGNDGATRLARVYAGDHVAQAALDRTARSRPEQSVHNNRVRRQRHPIARAFTSIYKQFAYFFPALDVGSGVAFHIARSAKKIHFRFRAHFEEVARHDEAVATVIALAAKDYDPTSR